jgi:DNA-binding transcriptional MerR regulator
MALTISEVADKIAENGTPKSVLVRRLRHWTREGLLRPVGKKRPGTGRHQLYDDAALEDAALLNAMADMGIQIGTMRVALPIAQQRRSEWGKAKEKEGKTTFLQIDSPAGGFTLPARLHFGGGEKAFIGAGFEKSIVFNLTQLFGRLTKEGG